MDVLYTFAYFRSDRLDDPSRFPRFTYIKYPLAIVAIARRKMPSTIVVGEYVNPADGIGYYWWPSAIRRLQTKSSLQADEESSRWISS